MLAAFQNLLFLWQLPILAVFIAGWVFGGGVLLRRSIRRRRLLRRVPLEKCIVASLLAGTAGVFSGGVLALLVSSIAAALEAKGSWAVPALAAALAVPVTLTVGFLVLYAMFPFTARQILGASAVPFGAVVLLAVVLAAPTVAGTYLLWDRNVKRTRCQLNLRRIFEAVDGYTRTQGRPPPNLDVLAEKYIPRGYTRCTAAPDEPNGFFYCPARPVPDRDTQQLLACDYRGRHGGGGRAVVFINGRIQWVSEDDFQRLLRDEDNAEFAKALAAAEKP